MTSRADDPPEARHRAIGARLGAWRLAALAALLVIAAVAAGLYWVWEDTGLLLVLVATQALTLVTVAFVFVRLDRRVHRTVRATRNALRAELARSEELERRLTDVVRLETDRQLERIGRELHDRTESLGQLIQATGTDLLRAQHGRASRVETALDQNSKRIQDTLRTDHQQLQALLNIHHLLDVRDVLPPMRAYSASPDFQAHLLSLVFATRPRHVLECGSGVSTLLIAYALERNGGGHLVSLEHLEDIRAATVESLDQHGLRARADVRLAPLTTHVVAGEQCQWYDTSSIEDGTVFDMLVIDGPPGDSARHARYPALPLLESRLSANATVVLDDYGRQDEQEAVQRWGEAFPDFEVQTLKHERGTAVLRRRREQ